MPESEPPSRESPEPKGPVDPDVEAAAALEEAQARAAAAENKANALKAQIDELKSFASKHSDADDPRRMHLLQIQAVRDVLVFALVFGVFWLGYVLRPITIPLLLALTLAYLVEPVVSRVVNRRLMTRVQAASSVILLIVVGTTVPLTVGSIVAVNQIVHTGGKFRENFVLVQDYLKHPEDETLQYRVRAMSPAWRRAAAALKGAADNTRTAPAPPLQPETTPGDAGAEQSPAGESPPPPQTRPAPPAETPAPVSAAPPPDGLPKTDTQAGAKPGGARASGVVAYVKGLVDENIEGISRFAARQVVGKGADALELAARLVKGIFVTGFSLFLVLFFFFFFSTGYGKVTTSLRDLIPKWRKNRTMELLRQMDAVIAGFVRGRLIIMAILMVAFTIGYWLIGVPGSFIVGPIVGVLAIIPYLGLISIPTSMLLMWLQPVGPPWQQQWWWILLAPFALYTLIQTVDDYVLTPVIQGKTTQLDTPTILFSVLAGGVLLGFYGVLIAIPLGACIKILLRESFWPRFRAWAEGRVKDFLPISRYDPAEASLQAAADAPPKKPDSK